MYTHHFQYRVIYADTDQMGFMYYGQYAKLYEIGRVEAIRALGISYKSLEEDGIWMPVYEVNSKYLEPAKYDELLTIKTSIHEMPKSRIVFHVEIENETGKCIHRAQVTLVFISAETRKIQFLPTQIESRLLPYFMNS
ncbi:MAG: acyl-CoA thioesterase [Leadbetterella sp.]